MELTIPTPRNFNFRRTVISHGWYGLLPFSLDTEKWQLARVIDAGSKPPVTIFLTGHKGHVRVETSRSLNKSETAIVLRHARHILRLDDDLQSFYVSIAKDPEFDWIGKQGAGRLLRSPTVYEDLVKMICTTNCSWALTVKMVTGLVQNLGRETNDGRRSFPTPEAMASMPADFCECRERSSSWASTSRRSMTKSKHAKTFATLRRRSSEASAREIKENRNDYLGSRSC